MGSSLVLLVTTVFAGWIAWKWTQRRRFLKQLRVARITPAELQQWLSAGEELFVVDLRSGLDGEPVLARVARCVLDAPTSERHRWISVDVEEVGRLEMAVALRLTCVDACNTDRRLDLCAREVISRNDHRPGNIAEATADGRDHEMFHRELDMRVRWIDLPSRRLAGRSSLVTVNWSVLRAIQLARSASA